MVEYGPGVVDAWAGVEEKILRCVTIKLTVRRKRLSRSWQFQVDSQTVDEPVS